MRVEILFFDGCPSYAALVPHLRGMVEEAGLESEAVSLVCVESPEHAEALRFLGSPSVRVNGVDVDPHSAGRDDFGWKCRIYWDDGAQVHAPPDAWIRSALARAKST